MLYHSEATGLVRQWSGLLKVQLWTCLETVLWGSSAECSICVKSAAKIWYSFPQSQSAQVWESRSTSNGKPSIILNDSHEKFFLPPIDKTLAWLIGPSAQWDMCLPGTLTSIRKLITWELRLPFEYLGAFHAAEPTGTYCTGRVVDFADKGKLNSCYRTDVTATQ